MTKFAYVSRAFDSAHDAFCVAHRQAPQSPGKLHQTSPRESRKSSPLICSANPGNLPNMRFIALASYVGQQTVHPASLRIAHE
ncbi:hypothetical protein [Paraburkholderia dilworthii]|uniref:hypothetical protein n=1 Tax=Paraburkholderia dilworthii TaxID=948106 RepID=UPI0004043A79|nr:hypothetical protein [Paraburkholderia dilworthii]